VIKAIAKIAISLCAVVPVVAALGQTPLDHDLKALYEKYGRDSVVKKVERDNPKAAEAAAKTKVPEDALAKEEPTEKSGFRLFKEQPFQLLFRRSYSDVTSGQDPSAKDAKESVRQAEAAQFSYSHDYLTGANQWSAVAAVIAPIELYRNLAPASQSGLALQLFDLVPSVSLNRITNDKDTSKEADELTFRVGVFSQWLGIRGPLRLLNLSGYATYATNSEFHDGGIIAGEIDLEPLTNFPGNRTFTRLAENGSGKESRAGSLIEYHWKAYLHTEFGGHEGSSTGSSQSGNNDFFRVGPVLSLQLDPFFLQRMNASVAFSYLAGVAGSPTDSHHLVAKLGFILDRTPDTDHWTLNATYEDGDTPLVQNRVRTFLLSLGVKY
jgi:hypothetical protein